MGLRDFHLCCNQEEHIHRTPGMLPSAWNLPPHKEKAHEAFSTTSRTSSWYTGAVMERPGTGLQLTSKGCICAQSYRGLSTAKLAGGQHGGGNSPRDISCFVTH